MTDITETTAQMLLGGDILPLEDGDYEIAQIEKSHKVTAKLCKVGEEYDPENAREMTWQVPDTKVKIRKGALGQ